MKIRSNLATIVGAFFSGLLMTYPVAANLRCTDGALPTIEPVHNSRYGVVQFKLRLLKNSRPYKGDSLQALLNSLSGVLQTEGTYLLTVELLEAANDNVIARKAIVQATRSKKGWWIFKRDIRESESLEGSGDLITNVLVRPDTNKIRFRLRSYYTQSVKLDLSTFNMFLDLIAKTKMLGAANTAIDAAWNPVKEQLEKLINSYEQKDVSDIVPLSFAKYGSPFPSQARCVREYKPNSDDTANYRAEVTVSTDISLESRTARVRGGKIQPPNPSVADVLALATIGDLPVEMVFLSSKSEDIKKFISALNATKGYEGEDIGERCVALEKELARSFSVADKAIAYWALMSLYSRKIAANKNGKDCVKDIKAQWAALGLGTEGLPHLTSQPIVVPTASVTEVDRTEIRSSNPAYVREITKNVTSTSTFSSFPAPLQ